MNYLIEFDTSSVLCQDEYFHVLDDYIKKHNLRSALIVVSCEEDFAFNFSKGELEDLAVKLELKNYQGRDADDLSSYIWASITKMDFPENLPNGEKKSKVKSETKPKVKPKVKSENGPKIKLKELLFICSKIEAKSGTVARDLQILMESQAFDFEETLNLISTLKPGTTSANSQAHLKAAIKNGFILTHEK